MQKNIRQKIRENVNEALDLAIKSIEVSNEAMQIHVLIPRKFQRATVVVQGQKRPFKLNKLEAIIRAFKGKWEKKPTTCKFTKVESVRHASAVSLIMRFYTGECLNPSARDKVHVQKGFRGQVLTPELCNGAEFSIMRGLGIQKEEEKKD